MNESSSTRAALGRYAGVLRRQWWLVAAVVGVALVSAAAYVATRAPVYASSMKIVVSDTRALFGPAVAGVQPFTLTMSDLLESTVVAQRVIADLDLDTTPDELLDRLTVTTRPDTSVIEVTYEDTDRERATQVLGAIGDEFTSLVDEDLGRAARRAVTVFDPAHPLPGQVSPRPMLTLAVAAVLGLLAGILLAFARDALMNRIRSEEDASEAFGAPVIGGLPPGGLGKGPAEIKGDSVTSQQLIESLQRLSATLRFSGRQLDRGIIVITSPMPEEGKTSVATQLASTLAEAGKTVAAVDADLPNPMLSRFFDLRLGERGLTDVAAGSIDLSDALVECAIEREGSGADDGTDPPETRPAAPRLIKSGAGAGSGRLLVLPAGRTELDLSGILSLGTSAEVVAQLRELADYVIIDTPPLLLKSDAFPLLQLADAVLVICRQGSTSRDDARRAREMITSLGIRDFSVVLTESSAAERLGYGYEYGRRDGGRGSGAKTAPKPAGRRRKQARDRAR